MSRKHRDVVGQELMFAPEIAGDKSRSAGRVSFEKDEFLKLMERLMQVHLALNYPLGAVHALSFEEIVSACRHAGAFTWLLPHDDSEHEAGRSAAQFGLLLKRFTGSTVRLRQGVTARLEYERCRIKRYRFAVGRDEGLTAKAEMRRLIEGLIARMRRTAPETASKALGVTPMKWEFRFTEVKRVCITGGVFAWLDLLTSSGESSLGLIFRKFRGERFQTKYGFYRFEENYRNGRARRYRIEAVSELRAGGATYPMKSGSPSDYIPGA